MAARESEFTSARNRGPGSFGSTRMKPNLTAASALGGLGDCVVMFGDRPLDQLRPAALGAAYTALGLPAEPVPKTVPADGG